MRVNIVRWMLFLLAVFQAIPCWAALNHNQNSVRALSKTYGFLLGQEYNLARIERTYPDLRIQVEKARLAFDASFSGAKEGLKRELTQAIGDANVKKLQAEMETKIKLRLDQQAWTPDSAEQFLDQVRAGAKGNEMDSDVLNYLLAVTYAKNPVGEFLDGFRQRFRTDGTGKAQGIKLTLQLPRSWLSREGERPHIVRKWTSEGGTGLSTVLLNVRDAEGYNPTPREIEQFVLSGEARQTFSDLGKVHDVGTFVVEGRTGYWGEISLTQERAGSHLYQRGMHYQLFVLGKAVGVVCIAGAREGEKQNADAAASRLKPVCQQVINSLVLEQAY
jgi:hypothetical protein